MRGISSHLVTAAAIILACGPVHANCTISPITNDKATIQFGAFTGDLLGSDDPDRATAWEGPLVIHNAAGKSCTADIGIIDSSFFFAGDHYLYVTIFSGSEANQVLVDARTCDVPWESPQFVGDPTLVNGDTFTYHEASPVKIGPDCLPIKKRKLR